MKFILLLLNTCLAYQYIIPDVIPRYNHSLTNIESQNVSVHKFFVETHKYFAMCFKNNECSIQCRYYSESYDETHLKQITFHENCQVIARVKYKFDQFGLHIKASQHWKNNDMLYEVSVYNTKSQNLPSDVIAHSRFGYYHILTGRSIQCVKYDYYEPINKTRIMRGHCRKNGDLVQIDKVYFIEKN